MKKHASLRFILPASLAVVALPYAAMAQNKGIAGLIDITDGLLQSLISLVFVAALFVFLWNLFIYLFKAKDEKQREDSKKFMTTAIIIFFVMTSIWGIIRILQETVFSDGDNNPISAPAIVQ